MAYVTRRGRLSFLSSFNTLKNRWLALALLDLLNLLSPLRDDDTHTPTDSLTTNSPVVLGGRIKLSNFHNPPVNNFALPCLCDFVQKRSDTVDQQAAH